MIRRPPRSTRTDTLFPYTTLFRSVAVEVDADDVVPVSVAHLVKNPVAQDTRVVYHRIEMAKMPDRVLYDRGCADRVGNIRAIDHRRTAASLDQLGHLRSEERRVGKECVSTCRSGWWLSH